MKIDARSRRRKMSETWVSYVFLAPFLVVFAVFLAWPVLYSMWLSLHKVTIFTDWFDVFGDMALADYGGFGNYVKILTEDTRFWWSLAFTFYYGALTIPTGLVLSLTLAILLTNKLKGTSAYRSAFFLPNVLDILVVGIIWVLIYSPEFGLLENAVAAAINAAAGALSFLGLLGTAEAFAATVRHFLLGLALQAELFLPSYAFENVVADGYRMFAASWGTSLFPQGGLLGHPATVLPAIALAMILKGAGFGMVLFLTSIQNIPGSIYEAADIDGATTFQQIRYITLPLLKPIFAFLVITGTMACLNAFSEVYAMTNSTGGPTTQLMATTVKTANLSGFYLFTNFQRGRYGYAAALSFVLLVIALLVSTVSMRVLRTDD